jgi:uncharacterized protein
MANGSNIHQATGSPTVWERLAAKLIAARIGLLMVAVLLGVAGWIGQSRLISNRSIEAMFTNDDPNLAAYQRLKSYFGGNEVVLFVFRDEAAFAEDGSGLVRLQKIREELAKVEGVQAVMDLSQLDAMLAKSANPISWLSGKPNHPILKQDDPLARAMLELFVGYTHSEDRTWIAAACMLDPSPQHVANRDATLTQLKAVVDQINVDTSQEAQAFLVGEPVMVREGFQMVEADGRRLGWVATFILAGLLLVGVKSIRWTLICILVVQWSLIVTQGLLGWMQLQMTMVSSMLASIVTVIGVATTIHWMSGYQKERAKGHRPVDAIAISLNGLIRPIVWACVTDAIGFGSLMLSNVGPVHDYGLMMAVASLVVLVGVLLLVPGLAVAGNFWHRIDAVPGQAWLQRRLCWMLDAAIRYRWQGIIVVALLCAVAVFGGLRIRVETNFIKNFHADSDLVKHYQVVERNFGGAGVWDIILPVPEKITKEYFQQVRLLEESLRRIEVPSDFGSKSLRLSKVLSLADLDLASQASPFFAALPLEARLLGMRQAMPAMMDTMLTPMSTTNDGSQTRWLRIMLRSPEQVDAESKTALISRVRATVKEASQAAAWRELFSAQQPASEVTGFYVLLTQLVDSVISDQWICFLVAGIGIAVAIWLAVGDWRCVLAALLPNILPAAVVLGIMGLLGIRMNLGGALIAAVSVGLSVDSSLHYLIRYKRELAAGRTQREALPACQSDVGIAMLISTFALVLGFGSLATSSFLPTVVFGTTAALTMLGGLLGNLWILPMFLSARQSP